MFQEETQAMNKQTKLFLHLISNTALRTCRTTIALFCLLFLSMATITLAKPITAEQAKSATQAWRRMDATPLKSTLGTAVSDVATFKDSIGSNLYYVVYLKPSGFVILPADDRVEPIIAFSSEGQYVDSDDNPLGALVRKDLPGRMAHVRKQDSTKDTADTSSPQQLDNVQKKWDTLLTAQAELEYGLSSISDVRVAPLVQSKWSQSTVSGSNCYNYYTPNNYVSGCVATALSQLMRFHQRPTTSVGTAAYSITVDGTSRSEALMGGNGSGGAYDWASMTLVPSSGVTTAQCQAIGRLMHDAGAAVNMDYTANSSGTDTLISATALKSTFGYSNAVKGYNSGSNLPTDARNAMVNPNLDTGLPVLFGITGSSGGHAIVGDGYGYQSDTMYHHLNMGWAGSSDLWYNLPDIGTNYNFTSVYKVVYNVYTTGSGEIISGRAIDCSGSPISGATVTATRSGYSTLTTTTNSNGIYSFKNVASGAAFTIAITKSGVTFSSNSQSITTGTSTDYAASTGNKWGIDFSTVCIPATLTVQRTGNGTVTSSPGGITCGTGGTACSAIFNKDSSVTLTATADSGSIFTGWSGGGCSGTGTCVVSLTNDTTVTATFTTATTLINENFDSVTPTALPSGWSSSIITSNGAWATHAGTVHPASIAAHSGSNLVYFNSWTVSSGSAAALISPAFSLSATANNSATFWIYRDSGYNNDDKVEVYVNTAANLTGATLLGTIYRYPGFSPTVAGDGWYNYSFAIPGTFTGTTNYLIFKGISGYGNDIHIDDISVLGGASNNTLTVSFPGTGSGSIISTSGPNPALNCSAPPCTASLTSGTAVSLQRSTTSLGSTFAGWSGCDSQSGDNCSLTMTADRTASATFTLLQYLKNIESGNYYGTLQAALTSATTSQTIRALAIQMLDPAGVNFNTSTSGVILKGGFSTLSDIAPTGYTSVTGPVQISSGSLTVENLIIK
jgi:hypothetical protein